jgi:hypothetical protein
MEMESFSTEFCEKLNSYLMEAMKHLDHSLAEACWMDGVLMPLVERQLNKKHVNDTRMIETHVWALTNKGDVKFELVIYFGKYSLRRYAKGLALDDCFPPVNDTGAVNIDFEKKLIELQLL